MLIGGGVKSQQGSIPEGSFVWAQGRHKCIHAERIKRCVRAKARHEHGMSLPSCPSPSWVASTQFCPGILASNEKNTPHLVFRSDIQIVAGAQNEESRVCNHKGDLRGQKRSILHGVAGTVVCACDLAVCVDHIECYSHSVPWHFRMTGCNFCAELCRHKQQHTGSLETSKLPMISRIRCRVESRNCLAQGARCCHALYCSAGCS